MRVVDEDKMIELRHFAIAAPYLMPMIEKRKADVLNRIIAAYRTNSDLKGVVAELAVYSDLERDLRKKHLELQRMQEESNG